MPQKVKKLTSLKRRFNGATTTGHKDPCRMSDVENSGGLVKHQTNAAHNGHSPSDFLWGAEQIGQPIGRNPRQTHYLLAAGEIKCAKKVGGLWCANRTALLREFGATA